MSSVFGPVDMQPRRSSKPKLSLWRLLGLVTGFGVSMALLSLANGFASTLLDTLGLAGISICAVYLLSAYTRLFQGRFAISLGILLVASLLVLATRLVAITYWRDANFDLPSVTHAAFHPLFPLVVAAILALAMIKDCVLRDRELAHQLNLVVEKLAVGFCIFYCLAILLPFATMIVNM